MSPDEAPGPAPAPRRAGSRDDSAMHPDVGYARNGDVHLAYGVMGGGPIDVMLVPMWFSNFDVLLQHPVVARGLEDIASYARLILWDRRGSGLSDRLAGPATLEEGMQDLLTVLDAAGSERAALIGLDESGTLCALTAASHPGRVSALVLYGSYATTTWHPDYPWGQRPDERALQIEWIRANWGSIDLASIMLAGADDRTLRWGTRLLHSSLTPDALPGFYEVLAKTDVRHVLPAIKAPTLVMHRRDDVVVPVDNSRYIADRIPGARYVELEGTQHVPFLGDWRHAQGLIEDFLTGGRHPRDTDRVLATILFTDIVDSTKKAAELGDARWKELLDIHDEVLRDQTERHQGRLVKTLGDGALATFDGPARAIRCAQSIMDALGESGLHVRCGLHTGEVEMRQDDLGGIAVHIAARVLDEAAAGEVLVSGAIPPLIAGSGISFEDRGTRELKGIEGTWSLYAVTR